MGARGFFGEAVEACYTVAAALRSGIFFDSWSVMKPSLKRIVANLLRNIPYSQNAVRAVVMLTAARFSVGVVGVVLDDEGRILLVKHVFHQRHPWGLPGGWVKHGERPQDAVEREIVEETGMRVRMEEDAPLCVDVAMRGRHIDMAFVCRARGDVVKLNSELLNYGWVLPHKVLHLSRFHSKAVESLLARNPIVEATT